jgi:hypothetical protein
MARCFGRRNPGGWIGRGIVGVDCLDRASQPSHRPRSSGLWQQAGWTWMFGGLAESSAGCSSAHSSPASQPGFCSSTAWVRLVQHALRRRGHLHREHQVGRSPRVRFDHHPNRNRRRALSLRTPRSIPAQGWWHYRRRPGSRHTTQIYMPASIDGAQDRVTALSAGAAGLLANEIPPAVVYLADRAAEA